MMAQEDRKAYRTEDSHRNCDTSLFRMKELEIICDICVNLLLLHGLFLHMSNTAVVFNICELIFLYRVKLVITVQGHSQLDSSLHLRMYFYNKKRYPSYLPGMKQLCSSNNGSHSVLLVLKPHCDLEWT